MIWAISISGAALIFAAGCGAAITGRPKNFPVGLRIALYAVWVTVIGAAAGAFQLTGFQAPNTLPTDWLLPVAGWTAAYHLLFWLAFGVVALCRPDDWSV